jgi:hypothetical protein
MKIEDFTGAVDIEALQAEEDFKTLCSLFRSYNSRQLVQLHRALCHRLELSEDQDTRLVLLIDETMDYRSWTDDDNDFYDG